jgi:hypothetical protein
MIYPYEIATLIVLPARFSTGKNPLATATSIVVPALFNTGKTVGNVDQSVDVPLVCKNLPLLPV